MKRILSLGLISFFIILSLTISANINSLEEVLASVLVEGETVTKVSLGGYHSSAITSEKRIFTWGGGHYGQLGNGNTIDINVPEDITGNFNLNISEIITLVSLGEYHSSAITSEGRIFTWGSNGAGQLGDGTTTNSSLPIDITSNFNLGSGEIITLISLGEFHSLATTSEGRIFTWGYNGDGELGDGTTTNSSIPIDITSNFNLNVGETVINVSLGGYHSSVITSEGRIFTWGANGSGKLGDGTTTNSSLPIDITSNFSLTSGEIITSISLGVSHSSAITSEGRIFTWGRGNYGQLGDGGTTDSLLPIDITSNFNLNEGELITNDSLGYRHSSAITSEERIFTWGYNVDGELGDGTTINSSLPIDITNNFNLDTGESISMIYLGDYHSSIITSEGVIFTWGFNAYGELGDGGSIDKDLPVHCMLLPLQTITFEENGGTIVSNITQEYGTTLIQPTDPILEWHTFDGWYSDSELSTTFAFTNTMPTNITLYAKWDANQYPLEYVDYDGTVLQTENYDYGADLSGVISPEVPSRIGYTFSGWSTTIPSTMGSESVILTAIYTNDQAVVEYVDYNGIVLQEEIFDYGADLSGVTPPNSPSRIGYTFSEWSGIIPPTMGTETITLTATYTANEYTLEYVDYDGTVIQTENYDYGTDLSGVMSPAYPSRTGYIFNGWSRRVPSTMEAETVTLTALYVVKQYIVEYVDHDGIILQLEYYDYEADLSSVTPPNDPRRYEYTFNGWSGTIPPTMGTETVTIIATYLINQYALEYVDYDGTVLQTENYDYGSDLSGVIPPITPSRTGYTLYDWCGLIPATMGPENITLTATYIINRYEISYSVDEYIKNTQDYNDLIAYIPSIPYKEGYSFLEWQVDGVAIDISTYRIPAKDITLIAIYKDESIPIISGVTDQNVYLSKLGEFEVPTAIVTDNSGENLEAVVTFFKANGVTSLSDFASVLDELELGNNVTIKYNVVDSSLNKASEVSTTINLIDDIKPTVDINDGTVYEKSDEVVVLFDGGTGMLNGEEITSGTLITGHGDYILVVTDSSGNVTTTSFTIEGSNNFIFYIIGGLLVVLGVVIFAKKKRYW